MTPASLQPPVPVGSRIAFETDRGGSDAHGVTVAVSARNYAHYVLAALDSVAAQTLSDLDLIVVDDGSTDDTLAVVHRWMTTHADRFRRTLLVTHARSYGVAAARHAAFARARRPFVFVLDADNELYPAAVERLHAACLHAGAAAAYSEIEIFGEESGIGYAGAWDPARLATGNYIDAMALVRRAAWEAVGGCGAFEVPGWEDYDLWCRFVEADLEGVFVPEILCRYRVHRQSMLRQETLRRLDDVRMELSLRHPWLRLD